MSRYRDISRGLLTASVVFGAATLGPGLAHAADKANPNGTWKFSLTFRDLGPVEELKLDLLLTMHAENGKLTGKIGAATGEGTVNILDGTFKGDDVAFRVVDQAGTPSQYRGKVEGDKIKGKFEAEIPGMDKPVRLDWNATRDKANPNGTWKFSLTFRDLGSMEELKLDLLLTMHTEGGKLTGKIGTATGEGMVDILDGTFKDDEVVFRVVDPAGTLSRYRGKVEGDKIKGKFEADIKSVDKPVHLDWNATREKAKT